MNTLPKPEEFKVLMQHLPQYVDDQWHEIFELALFRDIAAALLKGATVVTDLDHTVYEADAGFALIEAAIASGLLAPEQARNYHHKLKEYHSLPKDLEPKKFAQKEFTFYCDALLFFAGIPLKDLQVLANDLWLKGIKGILNGRPLLEALHPEIVYLFALNQRAKPKQNSPIAVTSSPDFAVLPGLEFMSLEPARLCSMKMGISKAGRLTDQIEEKIYGPLKCTAVRKKVSRWDYAFGDNPRNDQDFLVLAERKAIGIGENMRRQASVTYLPLLELGKWKILKKSSS